MLVKPVQKPSESVQDELMSAVICVYLGVFLVWACCIYSSTHNNLMVLLCITCLIQVVNTALKVCVEYLY